MFTNTVFIYVMSNWNALCIAWKWETLTTTFFDKKREKYTKTRKYRWRWPYNNFRLFILQLSSFLSLIGVYGPLLCENDHCNYHHRTETSHICINFLLQLQFSWIVYFGEICKNIFLLRGTSSWTWNQKEKSCLPSQYEVE